MLISFGGILIKPEYYRRIIYGSQVNANRVKIFLVIHSKLIPLVMFCFWENSECVRIICFYFLTLCAVVVFSSATFVIAGT